MVHTIDLVVEPVTDPRITLVLQALRGMYLNGGVIFRSVRPSDASAYDEVFASNPSDVSLQIYRFLSHPTLNRELPELGLPTEIPSALPLTFYSGYEYEGALTHALVSGGAFTSSPFSDGDARTMSKVCVEAMLGGEITTTTVCRIEGAWAPWFNANPWDRSFATFNHGQRRWTLLCLTDTNQAS
ncbi:hypothetical protein ACP8Y2_00440 [Herpetosiphon llansteffanensis]